MKTSVLIFLLLMILCTKGMAQELKYAFIIIESFDQKKNDLITGNLRKRFISNIFKYCDENINSLKIKDEASIFYQGDVSLVDFDTESMAKSEREILMKGVNSTNTETFKFTPSIGLGNCGESSNIISDTDEDSVVSEADCKELYEFRDYELFPIWNETMNKYESYSNMLSELKDVMKNLNDIKGSVEKSVLAYALFSPLAIVSNQIQAMLALLKPTVINIVPRASSVKRIFLKAINTGKRFLSHEAKSELKELVKNEAEEKTLENTKKIESKLLSIMMVESEIRTLEVGEETIKSLKKQIASLISLIYNIQKKKDSALTQATLLEEIKEQIDVLCHSVSPSK